MTREEAEATVRACVTALRMMGQDVAHPDAILSALTAPGEAGPIRYACALLQGHAVRAGDRVWIDAERWTEFCAVLSALAAPAPQETPLPEILCGACGLVLDVRRVDGRYLATGYCPQCDHTPPASAPEKCDGKGRLPGTPGFNGRVYTVCPGCDACTPAPEDAP